jgi:uncharacterized protein
MGRLLAGLVRSSTRRPWATVLVSLALALVAGLYTWQTLEFVTSSVRLLPQRARYVVLLKQYLQDFGELNDIVVAVESPDPERGKHYAERLVATLRQEGMKSRVTYRIDRNFFDRRGLLFLSVDDLTRLRDRLFDYEEFITEYAARPTLVRLLEGLNQQFANAMALGFLDLGLGGKNEADLRFLDAVVGQIEARLEGNTAYVSPWDTGFSLGRLDDPDAGYYFSSDKHLLFMFVEQNREEGDFASNRTRIERIRQAIARLAPEFPDIQAGVTGGPAISNDEMATAFSDSTLATGIAVLLTLAFLLVAFRRVGVPLLMLGTLIVSLLWAMGLISLVIGHLTIFSIMFISLIIGLGIDYGIYFLYRFQEQRVLGDPLTVALDRTAARTGPGILLGALTAAGTFLVLVLTEFQGIREFGFVSAVAILTAFLSMLTLFPALLALVASRSTTSSQPPSRLSVQDRLESGWLLRLTAHRKTILVGAAVLSIVGVWGLLGVAFNYNMLKLQAKGVESVLWEQRILARAGRSGFTALTTAGSLEELRAKQDAFSRLASVSKVESVLLLVPDHQPEKLKIIRQFAPLVAPIHVATPPALDPARLRAPLLVLQRRLERSCRTSRPGSRPRSGSSARRFRLPPHPSRSSKTRFTGTSVTSSNDSRRASIPKWSAPERRRPSSASASSAAAAATCCASTRRWTSGRPKARASSWSSCGPWIPTSPARR